MFTLLAIRFSLVCRVFIGLVVCSFTLLMAVTIRFWFGCFCSENIVAHHGDMYICSSFSFLLFCMDQSLSVPLLCSPPFVVTFLTGQDVLMHGGD